MMDGQAGIDYNGVMRRGKIPGPPTKSMARKEVKDVGMTFLDVKIANPGRPRKTVTGRFLVDSGAVYSVAPARLLARLGIKPHSRRPFTLADGRVVERRIGNALYFYGNEQGAAPVIFGEPGDSTLLGAVTLEALGLCLDPFRRELRYLPMLIG